MGTFCRTQNTNVHWFTLNLHGWKIMMIESSPLKLHLLRCYCLWEMSTTISHTKHFVSMSWKIILLVHVQPIYTTFLKKIVWFFFPPLFLLKNLKTNEIEASTCILSYIHVHVHSLWVGIHVIEKLKYKGYQNPLKPLDPFGTGKKEKSSQIYK